MRILVKLGGSLLTEAEALHRIIRQLIELQDHHHEVIVVHGGGKQIKQTLEQLEIPSSFHNGLRITDAATLRVVQMVLAGWVNKDIVAAFSRFGRRAVGICGGDGECLIARKYQDPDTDSAPVDYQFVGQVVKGSSDLVDALLREKYVPVIACIALGEDHAYYNVNADEMAAAAALIFGVDRLLFLTDVPGILDQSRQVIPHLSRADITGLREAGIIRDGMLPKTRACERALEEGLKQVHIVGGNEPNCLIRVLLQGQPLGTTLS
ncbi:MAG: acetylglutamate kinase [Acidobacteriota bacterium]